MPTRRRDGGRPDELLSSAASKNEAHCTPHAAAMDGFYREWRQESSPWGEAHKSEVEGGGTFRSTFLLFLAVFALLNVVGKYIGKRRPNSPLSTRPTVLAGTFHALATSIISIYLLVARPPGDVIEGNEQQNGTAVTAINWSLWQTVAIPLSLAYFAADAAWYCLPRSDGLIFFHHLLMCFCHYPIINRSGATLAGGGDAPFSTWLSVVGYTSEVSTCLMNYRWYLLQTLEADWVGFAIVNVLVVMSWSYRIVLFVYLLLWEIIPRTPQYVETKQLLTYIIMFSGHAIIGALSVYWLQLMCKGGIKGLLTFRKKKRSHLNGTGGFSFGDDIGREARGQDEKLEHNLIQQGLAEAKDYVDGSLFPSSSKRKAL